MKKYYPVSLRSNISGFFSFFIFFRSRLVLQKTFSDFNFITFSFHNLHAYDK